METIQQKVQNLVEAIRADERSKNFSAFDSAMKQALGNGIAPVAPKRGRGRPPKNGNGHKRSLVFETAIAQPVAPAEKSKRNWKPTPKQRKKLQANLVLARAARAAKAEAKAKRAAKRVKAKRKGKK